MLDHGYGFGEIEDEIETIEGLDPEEQSALWVWAWTFEDMGLQQGHGPRDARLRSRPPAG